MVLAVAGLWDAVIAVLIVCGVVTIVGIVAFQVRIARVAAYNARLKQLMIGRNMPAGEIERVIKAGPKRFSEEFPG